MIRVEAAPALHPDDIGIRLVGCLVKSDDGYLLINLPSEPTTGTLVAGAVGTSGVSSTIVYLLEDNDELTVPGTVHPVNLSIVARELVVTSAAAPPASLAQSVERRRRAA
jgi:hypothetical protein